MQRSQRPPGESPRGFESPPGRTIQPYKHWRPPAPQAGSPPTSPAAVAAAAQGPPERGRADRPCRSHPAIAGRHWKDALASLAPRRTVPPGTVPPIGGAMSRRHHSGGVLLPHFEPHPVGRLYSAADWRHHARRTKVRRQEPPPCRLAIARRKPCRQKAASYTVLALASTVPAAGSGGGTPGDHAGRVTAPTFACRAGCRTTRAGAGRRPPCRAARPIGRAVNDCRPIGWQEPCRQ